MSASRWRHLLTALIVMLAIVVVRAVTTGSEYLGILTGFEEAIGMSVGPDSAYFARGLTGDGATFTIVAIDPFGSDVGRLLFDPSYRYLRFGSPWLAALVVLGSSDFVLLGLSVVGLASVGLIAYLASILNETRGPWAWLLICNPAVIIGALGDTAEPMALALISLAIFTGSALVGWTVALVRPTYLVALASRWRVFALGVVTAGVAKIIWSWRFGESMLASPSVLTFPFGGVLDSPTILGWAVVLAGLITAVIGGMRRDWSWVVSGVLVLCLGPVVVDTPTNAVRAAGFLPLLWAFGPRFAETRSLRSLFARTG